MSATSLEQEPIFTIAKKWRQAVLRQQRLTFTAAEVDVLAGLGTGKIIAQAAEDRLCIITAERSPQSVIAPMPLPRSEGADPTGPDHDTHPAGGDALLVTLRKRGIQRDEEERRRRESPQRQASSNTGERPSSSIQNEGLSTIWAKHKDRLKDKERVEREALIARGRTGKRKPE